MSLKVPLSVQRSSLSIPRKLMKCFWSINPAITVLLTTLRLYLDVPVAQTYKVRKVRVSEMPNISTRKLKGQNMRSRNTCTASDYNAVIYTLENCWLRHCDVTVTGWSRSNYRPTNTSRQYLTVLTGNWRLTCSDSHIINLYCIGLVRMFYLLSNFYFYF